MPGGAASALSIYWRGLYLCLVRHGAYAELRALTDSKRARLQIYSLALHFRLWHREHYRSGTFQKDLQKNLCNVAVPKTGMPLSLLCYSRVVAAVFLAVLYPLLCAVGALVRARRDGVDFGVAFGSQLLEPEDWFAFWRLNCVLASYHAQIAGGDGYEMEDKLAFLERCEAVGLPPSPWLKLPTKLICKHRNEEGGLGFASYSNAAVGGDWLLQPALQNAREIARLLPADAPLSTLRLVSASRHTLRQAAPEMEGSPEVAPEVSPEMAPNGGAGAGAGAAPSDVSVLSACWRAGRAGAMTDHSSIVFDVDLPSGRLKRGTSNAHWYQLGPTKAWRCPWRSEGHTEAHHPDTNARIEGELLPDMGAILRLVRDAHARMCPAVPLVGWDVALTTEGTCLLEANLSCNFFRASFDKQAYFGFVEETISHLEIAHLEQREGKKRP